MWKSKCCCGCLSDTEIYGCKWVQLQTSRTWYQQWQRSRESELKFMQRKRSAGRKRGMEPSLGGTGTSTRSFPCSKFHIPAAGLFHLGLSLLLSPRDPSHSPDQALNNQTNSLSSLPWLWKIPFDLEAPLLKQAKGEAEWRRRRFLLQGSFSPTLFLGWDSCFEVQATLKSYKGFKAPSEGQGKNGQLQLLIQSALIQFCKNKGNWSCFVSKYTGRRKKNPFCLSLVLPGKPKPQGKLPVYHTNHHSIGGLQKTAVPPPQIMRLIHLLEKWSQSKPSLMWLIRLDNWISGRLV